MGERIDSKFLMAVEPRFFTREAENTLCFTTIEFQCAAPENINTPPTEGIGISWGLGVL